MKAMTPKQIMDQMIKLLTNTNRAGMDQLIEWMKREGFFASPASTRFHGCYPGGLAKHSWDVFQNMEGILLALPGIDEVMAPGQRPLKVSKVNVVIASLLHDLNKVGLYEKTKPGSKTNYYTNKSHEKGHGELSVTFASRFINLEPIEVVMIRFHMGIYGTFEMDDYCSEYPLKNQKEKKKYKPISKMTPTEKADKEADQALRYCTSLRNAWYHNPICKVLSIADELATLEEKLQGQMTKE